MSRGKIVLLALEQPKICHLNENKPERTIEISSMSNFLQPTLSAEHRFSVQQEQQNSNKHFEQQERTISVSHIKGALG